MDDDIKKIRYAPDTERLLKQFCRMESSVDARAYNIRHVYMEQCGNLACSPHLTDAERAMVAKHVESGLPFEESVYEVLDARAG